MTPADERLILHFYKDWNERGVESLPDSFADEAIWRDDPVLPDGDIYRGLQAMTGRLATYVEIMGNFQIMRPGVTDLGDGRYLAEFGLAARGEGSGIEWEQPHGHLLRLADGKIVEAQQVIDPVRMRRELGLPAA